LPQNHCTSIFSATISQNLQKLISLNLPNALEVKVPIFKGDLSNSNTILAFEKDTEYETKIEIKPLNRQNISAANPKSKQQNCEVPQSIENFYAVLKSQVSKLNLIHDFIAQNPNAKCVLFFSTCACVEFYYEIFARLFPTYAFTRIHRKMSQNKRNKVYEDFLKAPQGFLLCTDILARGIDIPDIEWIIQYDPPQHSDTFLHRIGRTARAGKQGKVHLINIR